MALSRFYCADPLSPGAVCSLPEWVSRHAVRVLRMKVGSMLVLFDGRGGEYPSEIVRIQRDEVVVRVGQWVDREVESPCRVTLVQSLQAAEKMDFTLQKAVELGVAAIQPLSARRSVMRLSGERAEKRRQHWQSIVVSACEQSGRNQVPVVAPVRELNDWLATQAAAAERRLILAPGAAQSLSSMPPPAGEVQLLIGPEGGFDPEELGWAESVGFVPVSLGPRILRTETAGMAALAVMQSLWGDWR